MAAPSAFAPPVPGPTPNLPEPGTVWLTREQLEIHAGGAISEIFGELFEQQDGYERQVRMPEPPLLFADRALLVEGEPGTMKKGRVVTETDVREDAWYLHDGRMAPGVVIDLRGNPGGLGAMAMGMSGWFVADKGHQLGVMTMRTGDLKFAINPRANGYTGPVAILTDEITASTSEIMAGGMQDLGRARLFGATSAGAALPSIIDK